MLTRFIISVSVALVATSAPAARASLPQCRPTAPAPPLAPPCRQFYLDERAPASTSPSSDEQIFCHSFYAISYSPARRDPVWTSYRLTGEMAGQSDGFGRRGRRFAGQVGLSPSQQPSHDSWKFPPFARGHMTPDNDAPTCATQADTYWVTNIVPQVSGFNSGLWAGLERAVHGLAISEGEVFVVTGPLFEEPSPPMNGIAVPSSIFKAIWVPSRGFALAFVSTNANPTRCAMIAIADLERRAGFNPFPSLPSNVTAGLPAMPPRWGKFPARCRPR